MTTQNILLVTVDSLRYDRLGPGYDSELTPTINELADDGAQFSAAIANGCNTRTSFPSILTGTYPLFYGGYSYLSEDRPFVAEQFRKAGYETVGYHSNPHLGRDQNYDTGFDVFNDEAESSDSISSLKDRVERRLDPDSRIYAVLRRLWHRFSMTTGSAAYAKADTISNNAIDWLDSYDGDEPFFIWLHYMDVHYPFTPPKEHLRELGIDPLSDRRVADLNGKMHERPAELSEADHSDLIDLYHGEIRFVDAEIERVLEKLAAEGYDEETTVTVTADHGEAFGEHGQYGHKPGLYDELLRVPLVMDAPQREPQQVDKQVSLLDLGPTLLELADIEVPSAMDGESVFSTLDERPVVSVAASGEMLSARTTQWKCFWRVADETIELYDLTTDPDETTDVSDDHPTVVEEFRELLTDHREAARQTDTDVPEVDTSKETEQRLRDLGYME